MRSNLKLLLDWTLNSSAVEVDKFKCKVGCAVELGACAHAQNDDNRPPRREFERMSPSSTSHSGQAGQSPSWSAFASTPNSTNSPGANSPGANAPAAWEANSLGFVSPQKKRPQSNKQANLLTECFLSCGDKSRGQNQPKRLTAPPSEILFKNGVRALWADKHCPRSLSAFQCHSQQTQQLQQLISCGNCPHLLFQGPSGAGKKALALAVLHDIFGDVKVLPEHRPFVVQSGKQTSVTIPVVTSRYHVELNVVHIGDHDKDILPTIFKEIHLSSDHSMQSPIITHRDFGFKLILLQNAELLSENAQKILHKLMDRYGDTCKLVLCCNHPIDSTSTPMLREGIRSRCQIVDVEVPTQEEIVKVLNNVAKKEDLNLPKAFAAKIAGHCKDSLRKAIVQLEACKSHQYPFAPDQMVHKSIWEEDVIQIVAEIVAEPTPKRLFSVRTKMQALLDDSISPILILQKLLEEFLLQTDATVKKQICHWAGFYETRLRTVPNPIYQLEAFLAKVMSLYKSTKPRTSFCGSGRASWDRSSELDSPIVHR